MLVVHLVTEPGRFLSDFLHFAFGQFWAFVEMVEYIAVIGVLTLIGIKISEMLAGKRRRDKSRQ